MKCAESAASSSTEPVPTVDILEMTALFVCRFLYNQVKFADAVPVVGKCGHSFHMAS